MPLTPDHLEALRLVCDTFAPALERPDDPHGLWARPASALGVHEQLAAHVAALGSQDERELAQLLDLLNRRVLGLTWGGPLKPIAALTPVQRERMLQRWSRSPVPLLRQAFGTLRKLTGFFFYGLAEPDRPNPNWPAIGYPGPLDPPEAPAEPALRPLVPDADSTLTCDTVVVGSGAGGGVVAGELAAAGEDVIVVEKGPYVPRSAFDGLEGRAMERMYERRGSLVTADGAVNVLAGSCLGGGTTINWAGSFRTPDYVLRQWAEEHAAPHFQSAAFARGFAVLEEALDIGTDRGAHNPQNRALRDGCRALGHAVEPIPRNTRRPETEAEWRSLGFSPFGDRLGLKQGVAQTYLARAAAHGARLLADTEVERVRIGSGRAAGVDAVWRGADGRTHRVTIRARRVVVAAGSIHTPALLLRSGVEHPHLGRHLYFHPTVAVAARYPEPMEPWYGPMMSAVSNAFTKLDGTYGAKLETPPTHAGILGLALPWASGEAHKAAMLGARHTGSFIVLTRDRDGGRVTVRKGGRPVLRYRLSAFDRRHLLRGMQEAARIHLAAGAERLFFPHN
ncbi:MAG: GMC family oxidoreductase N-terminal domain-containing protein, partial [Rhodothermales bacterium]|nr:GMC family oxidoreductase N-terminal domain-containing protein [Rhodothermales bacterium]